LQQIVFESETDSVLCEANTEAKEKGNN